MADVKIKRYRTTNNVRLYNNPYRPIQLTYRLLEGLYDRTYLKPLIQKLVANTIPPFYTLIVEDVDGNRLPELEKSCKDISRIIDRTYMASLQKAYLLHGTALTYKGNVDNNNHIEELFLLHPSEVDPYYYEFSNKRYGEIKYWRYTYGGQILEIPPEDISVYANDPGIGEMFGNSIVNHLQDTLAQFLNNRTDLAEILNRYAIPIVQWAVDVSEVQNQSQDKFILQVKRTLQEQFMTGDDLITDARIEPRTLSFANDVGHLINILGESRKDLGMLGIPESLMGGQISNLSGGKTQAAIFMTDIERYRANLNDYLAQTYYIPHLEKEGYTFGEDFHNVYIAFPLATTELPSDKVIWLKTAVEMGWITNNEARAELGFRGAAPGVTDELKETFEVRSVQYNSDQQNQEESNKVNNPKDRSGKDPESSDSTKKSDAGDT